MSSDSSIEQSNQQPNKNVLINVLKSLVDEEIQSVLDEEDDMNTVADSKSFHNFSVIGLCNPCWLLRSILKDVKAVFKVPSAPKILDNEADTDTGAGDGIGMNSSFTAERKLQLEIDDAFTETRSTQTDSELLSTRIQNLLSTLDLQSMRAVNHFLPKAKSAIRKKRLNANEPRKMWRSDEHINVDAAKRKFKDRKSSRL